MLVSLANLFTLYCQFYFIILGITSCSVYAQHMKLYLHLQKNQSSD